MKSVFNKIENNTWKIWYLRLAELPLYKNHPIVLLCKSLGLGLFNGNAGLKWQHGCMLKVNFNLYILFIVSTIVFIIF